jgi:PAS domain S-box-containing protein
MDRQNDIITLIKTKTDELILAFIIVSCIIVTIYVNLIMGINVVYTHLYYIPIILMGIRFPRKAPYLALFLGFAHVSIGYIDEGHLVADTFIRAAIFLVVAFVVGYISEKMNKLYNNVRLLLESTDEGIYGIDMQGRCTFINRSAQKILGYSPEEILDKDMHDLIHHTRQDGKPCTRDEGCVVHSLREGVGCRDSDDIFWRKDGTYFPVEFSSSPIKIDKKINGAVITFVDITARKKAEEEIRDAREQAEFYVDLMGHDINNMNQIGISNLELALEKLKLSDEERAYLLRPIEILCNSSRLIDTVRKLQLVKSGNVKHDKIDMCRILQEVVSQHSHTQDRDVTINFKPSRGCYVIANDLLKDVFSNLIGNAIKHTTGPVVIDIGFDKITRDQNKCYQVTVSDNGPGISDELKKKIFSRFQRGETKATGRGLGLYLIKKLVDDFHGKVWVEDRVPGDRTKGSRFVVILPIVE